MKFNLTFISVAILLAIACEKEKDKHSYLSESAADIEGALEDAYQKDSYSLYKDILDEWHSRLPSKPFDSLNREIEKDVYKIFQILYDPFAISSLGEHEWGELYEGYDYAVVQNFAYFNYTYDSVNHESRDSIGDFRPELHLDGKTILYLKPEYHQAIYAFLGVEYVPLGTGGIMNPSSPTGESRKRLEFLWKYLYIIPGHWGGYYHIVTHPEMYLVTFNTNADKARAYFRVGYMFGEAEFERINNNWEMMHSAITGIEK